MTNLMAAYKGGESFYRDTGPKSLSCYVVRGPISILVLALLSGLWDYKKCTARWEANVVNVIGDELKGMNLIKTHYKYVCIPQTIKITTHAVGTYPGDTASGRSVCPSHAIVNHIYRD